MLADVVEELAGRLWAAGVRPSEQVVVHKTDNVDIVLLACAVSRIGAVPVAAVARRWPARWPGSSSHGCAGPG